MVQLNSHVSCHRTSVFRTLFSPAIGFCLRCRHIQWQTEQPINFPAYLFSIVFLWIAWHCVTRVPGEMLQHFRYKNEFRNDNKQNNRRTVRIIWREVKRKAQDWIIFNRKFIAIHSARHWATTLCDFRLSVWLVRFVSFGFLFFVVGGIMFFLFSWISWQNVIEWRCDAPVGWKISRLGKSCHFFVWRPFFLSDGEMLGRQQINEIWKTNKMSIWINSS